MPSIRTLALSALLASAIACGSNSGTAGPAGATGPTGDSGPAGPSGDAGPQGIAGPTGPTGAEGERGATGAQGLAGATGAPGAQGATGSQGAPGLTGAAGVAGPTGAAGASVTETVLGPDDPNCPAGGVKYLVGGAAGSAVYVCNGAAGDAGPQGEPGLAGATGATGAAGAQGLQGLRGATGATGPSGASGATGNNGATGATGNNGVAGNNGAAGNTGATGPTGATGNNGAAGSTGATGLAGTNGNNGAAGSTGPAGPAGASGNNGAAGNTGATGPAGVTGATGVSAGIARATLSGFTCTAATEGQMFYDAATFQFFACANQTLNLFSLTAAKPVLPPVTNGLLFNLDAATYVQGSNVWKDNSSSSGPTWNLLNSMDALWNTNGWFAMNGNGAYALNPAGTTLGAHTAYTLEVIAGYFVAQSSTIVEQTSDNSGSNRDIASLKWGSGPCANNVHMYGSWTASASGVQCFTSGTINTTGWSYFQSTYDGSTVSWLENGVARGAVSRTGATGEMKFFYIGKGGYPSAGEPMNGQLAIVRLYSRALSSGELQSNYAAFKARFSLP